MDKLSDCSGKLISVYRRIDSQDPWAEIYAKFKIIKTIFSETLHQWSRNDVEGTSYYFKGCDYEERDFTIISPL